MKIPFKIRYFNKFVKWPRYIIFHDINCLAKEEPKVRIDNGTFQTNYLRSFQYIKHMLPDLNYHFVVEKIRGDYEVVLGRPLAVHCEYDDIKSPYNFAFHVCVMGNYDLDVMENRLYQKIAYNIIAPLMRTFKLNTSRILLHSEISKNKIECPGEFFNKKRLISHVTAMRLS